MSETTDFWRGDFGDSYVDRNNSPTLIKNNEALFRKALMPMFHTTPMRIIEFGANIGLNIHALRRIAPFANCEYSAVEPNEKAADELRKIENVNVYQTTMQDSAEDWGRGYDLALTRGTLIHVEPKDLPLAYGALYRATRRYVLVAEYHSVKPVEVEYRGYAGKLWKRDFAAEMLDMFPDLCVVNYGFAWHRDPYAPQDDITYTLMERDQGMADEHRRVRKGRAA
jgi:pseudaminic acid biosynthesis-associated methylase